MRALLLLCLLTGVTAAPASARQGDQRQPQDRDRVDPAALFESRCASCHAVPDPSVRTDRAWLGQIAHTA